VLVKMNWKSGRRKGYRRKRILLVDNNALVRDAIARWINRTRDLEVCAEADSPRRAMNAVKASSPNLVLTEIMQQQDLGFIRELRLSHPRLPILVFSFREEGWYAPRALEAGACGYLMKGVDGHRLLTGIRRTLRGRAVVSPGIRSPLRGQRLRPAPARRLASKRARGRDRNRAGSRNDH
jgi:DNA-binding NarL/FixJ family response regulator